MPLIICTVRFMQQQYPVTPATDEIYPRVNVQVRTMKPYTYRHVYISFGLIFTLFNNGVLAANLSCYQCKRNTNVECSPSDLLPCPPSSDRCVTHIINSVKDGFTIKRECGLGPCGFDDVMVNKGLGLDNCDRSKSEYFCLSCCRENGCNKNKTNTTLPSKFLLFTAFLIICLLNVTKEFIPPFYSNLDKK